MALILSSQSNLIFNIFSSKLYKIRVGHFKIRPLDYLDKKIKTTYHCSRTQDVPLLPLQGDDSDEI